MTDVTVPPGLRVTLPQFAESQRDALENVLKVVNDPGEYKIRSDEVLVRVQASSVAFADLLMLSGQYQHKPRTPFTPGMEYSGDVVAVGGVAAAEFDIGDRVVNDFTHAGPRSTGAYQAHGGWATYAVAPASALHKIPDTFSYEQGANLFVNYETAYYALVNRARLQAGEVVLITGASGAAGMATVQTAKILGAKVIVTGRSEEKLRTLRDWGADATIHTTGSTPGRFRDQVKEFTGGNGADVVIDTVGGPVGLEGMRSLSYGGRLVIVGWAANTTVAQGGGRGGSDGANLLPTNIIQMKGLYVMGSPMVIHTFRDPSIRPPRIAAILDWVEQGLITPFVSHRYPLSGIRDAGLARLAGHVTGGCVVEP
ncbi:NADPH:quinone oxidoreductase family protein [Pseudonocardia sp. RS010]|uniref:NADPH:quinone oxidoreductase family protein n=1 Tax=Pseudonocardia sp. RS010 TaxID=3385979 RepID=UPI0039A25634